MNARFVQAVQQLIAEEQIVPNDRGGKGMGDFAEQVFGDRRYGSWFRACEQGRRCVSREQVLKFCEIYGVEAAPILGEAPNPPQREASIVPIDRKGSPIVFIKHLRASASPAIPMPGAVGGHDGEAHASFVVPGLYGQGLLSFQVEGNSMEPLIADGDLIICEALEDPASIRDNGIYAILHEGELNVKYVQRLRDERGRLRGLKLISENKLEHDPFEVAVDKQLRVYKVKRCIKNFE